MDRYLWGRRELSRLRRNSFNRQPDLNRGPHSIRLDDLVDTCRNRRVLRPRPLPPSQVELLTRPANYRHRQRILRDEEIWWEAIHSESWDYCFYLDDRSRRAILERG
jgi:hypothetical protein